MRSGLWITWLKPELLQWHLSHQSRISFGTIPLVIRDNANHSMKSTGRYAQTKKPLVTKVLCGIIYSLLPMTALIFHG